LNKTVAVAKQADRTRGRGVPGRDLGAPQNVLFDLKMERLHGVVFKLDLTKEIV